MLNPLFDNFLRFWADLNCRKWPNIDQIILPCLLPTLTDCTLTWKKVDNLKSDKMKCGDNLVVVFWLRVKSLSRETVFELDNWKIMIIGPFKFSVKQQQKEEEAKAKKIFGKKWLKSRFKDRNKTWRSEIDDFDNNF